MKTTTFSITVEHDKPIEVIPLMDYIINKLETGKVLTVVNIVRDY
jgi:hypothetical protein